jgi:hypothetical protein
MHFKLGLTEPQLKQRWVRDAASALALMILEIQDSPMEGGTLYHAVHGLRLYTSRQSASFKMRKSSEGGSTLKSVSSSS